MLYETKKEEWLSSARITNMNNRVLHVRVDNSVVYGILPTSKHYYAGSERIVSKTADDAYFYFTDHLGSTTHITDRSGDVAQYAAYTPYGSLFREYRSVQPYKFNGKELDQETGYYYYGARYYDQTTALWLGTDPLAEKYPGIGAYVYCAGNPVKYVDPDGRDWYESENGNVFWQKGSAVIDGYKNIGACYSQNIGDGITLNYTQNEVTSIITNTMNKNQFISQFSKSDWDGTPSGKACNKACDAMLSTGGYVSGSMKTIVTNNGNGIAGHANGAATKVIAQMSTDIDFGKPTKVNIDFRAGSGSADKMGDHFIVVQGKTDYVRNGRVTSTNFNFFDPGTQNKIKGTSVSNILRIVNNRLEGIHINNGRVIVVTSIR